MEELNNGHAVDRIQTPAPDAPATPGAPVMAARLAEGMAETFQALADPTRVRLVSVLVVDEACVGDLAAALGMSVSAISHQLALLYRLRIVKRRREGRNVYYALDDEHVETIYRCGLEHLAHS